MKQLSRSVGLMFIFDLLVLAISTYSFSELFLNDSHITLKTIVIALVVVVGLFSLFLKGHYKIREFNNTFKNAWLLFEGIIFANIPAGILLFFFIPKSTLVKFLVINILTIFV